MMQDSEKEDSEYAPLNRKKENIKNNDITLSLQKNLAPSLSYLSLYLIPCPNTQSECHPIIIFSTTPPL